MRAKLFFACLLLCYCSAQSQQVIIDDNKSPEELIQNTLFQGCIEITNITTSVNGSINGLTSYGVFQKASSNFPFQNGIVLTTGDVNDAGNVFNSEALNKGNTDWGSDADLESVLGVTNTYNATAIEFDFIAASEEISFNYILASEEYLNDYPCNYSDSFAFLIKPSDNSAPYTNITLIPGTSTNVSTQNIRPEIVGFCDALNQEYFDNFNIGDTNYNGRTTVLTAQTAIQPNTSYHIKLVIADQFDENFDSAVFIEGNTFTTNIELGDAINTCYSNVLLNTGITNPQATFEWKRNGTVLQNTSATLDAVESGTYEVKATIPYAGNVCIVEDSVEVTLNGIQDATEVANLEICYNTDDTSGVILSDKNVELAASVPFTDALVTYFSNFTDAQNNTNSITDGYIPSQSNETIYVRIQDATSSCLAYNTFELIYNETPVLTTPDTLLGCVAYGTNIADYDLSIAGNEATNNNTSYSLTYYPSETDAENSTNSLPIAYSSNSASEIIYLKATDTATSCYSIIPITLQAIEGPQVMNTSLFLDACEPTAEGFADFNLENSLSNIIADPTLYTIEYYLSEATAIAGINPITTPNSFTNTLPYNQTVFVKVINPDTGCFTLAALDIYTSVIVTEVNTDPYPVCDGPENDGIADFNLEILETYILNGLDEDIYSVNFYTNETDQLNNTNALDISSNFQNTSNPQTLYLNIEKTGECGSFNSIDITVNPFFSIGNVPDQTYCDDNSDGVTLINTADFNSLFTSQTGFYVSYHLSETEAINHVNPVTEFVNQTNPVQLYALVGNGANCEEVISFSVQVNTAPETNTPNDLYFCDSDQDGMAIVNLTDVIPELIDDTNGTSINFFTSILDAENNTNAISNTTNFNTSSTEIFVRSTNNSTGCYNIKNFMVYVAFFPDLTAENSIFTLCENDGNQKESFFFENYDATIVNNEIGLEVFYFLNQNDALNNTNSIDKYSGYENISNPQTIYVRRQSEFNTNCFTVDPITIKVSAYPIFNNPEDLFLCDDISNNGKELFDLNAAIQNMGIDTNNVSVNFYTTFNNAENDISPLPTSYENVVNPQTIWAKVQTNEGCYEAVSFKLNVIHVGLINEPSPVSYCDSDNNGYEIVDLTSDDVDVLMIRQNEIILSYYETEDDAINLTNPINNPTNYAVNANNETPTTVYIVATNAISNCSLYVSLDLFVYNMPQLPNETELDLCQEDITKLNLSSVTELINNNNSDNIVISYYNSYENAVNENNPLPSMVTVNNQTITVFAKATHNVSGCYTIKPFTVNLNEIPPTYELTDLRTCSNASSVSFDLLNALNNQNTFDFSIDFFTNLEDAEANTNPISNKTHYLASDNEVIYTRFTNTISGCYSIATFSTYLDAYPIIALEPEYVLCPEYETLFLNAYTGNDNDTYLWSDNSTDASIEISNIGTYSLTITSEYGCENTLYFSVRASESAIVTDIETVSFTDSNSITVHVSGIGHYVYSLDGGSVQTSNIFTDVSIGYHTVNVYDEKGCSPTVVSDVVILGFPKYFTPNGDGTNDSWNIFGFETLSKSNITIFDRYGKFLKVIAPGDVNGWDGTYNGHIMPSTDYWFEATINDTEKPFVYRGHFSLKR